MDDNEILFGSLFKGDGGCYGDVSAALKFKKKNYLP